LFAAFQGASHLKSVAGLVPATRVFKLLPDQNTA
jgi:hypothetical protein